MTVRYDATQKLINIYDSSLSGPTSRLAAVEALGRVGGFDALEKLLAIYEDSSSGSATKLAVITALGEVGRVE